MQNEHPPSFSNQSAIRQHYLLLRRNISAQQLQQASQSVCQQILNSQHYEDAQHIAAYFSVGNEINLSTLIQQAVQDGKQIYLPRIVEQDIVFSHYTGPEYLVKNRFGILEPCASNVSIQVEQLDIIYLPLVAFDKHGHRIGMGGGYYDRYLSSVKNHSSPSRIGVAHAIQKADDCLANEWDIPLHHIIQAS